MIRLLIVITITITRGGVRGGRPGETLAPDPHQLHDLHHGDARQGHGFFRENRLSNTTCLAQALLRSGE